MVEHFIQDKETKTSINDRPMVHDRILIIVPAFNESGNIQKTVKEICSLSFPVVVLVVNDGSTDRTALEAQKAGALVVSLPFNLGIGGAVQTGFKFALEQNFEFAVQVDGDGQHDIRYLQKLLEPVVNKKADISIGSRFLPPHLGYQSSFVRRLGIHFFAYLISFLTNCKVTDPTSGFRAFNRKMIRVFAQSYPHDFPEPEAIVIARCLNATVVEIPVEMRKRTIGNSSIRYVRTLYYMMKVTFAILLNMIKKRRSFEKWE